LSKRQLACAGSLLGAVGADLLCGDLVEAVLFFEIL